MVISEDIIKKALNESIDEFMINEANWGKAFGNAWNGVKNAAAMYMDWRTNGQWNNKYGIYANANTKTGELFYFNKWLNFYKSQLNNIIYKATNPDNPAYDEEYTDETGNKFTKRKVYNYSGPQGALNYAQKYCTFQNFNDYIRAINSDRESVSYINTYIRKYITNEAKRNNLNAVLNSLNISNFYASIEGQSYLKMDRGEQQNSQKINRQNKQQTQQPIQQQNQNSPIPDSNGKFTLPQNRYPYNGANKLYKGWIYSYDKNGQTILINPNNNKQAVFVPNN